MRIENALLLCAAFCLPASALIRKDVRHRQVGAPFAKPNGTTTSSQQSQQPEGLQDSTKESITHSSSDSPLQSSSVPILSATSTDLFVDLPPQSTQNPSTSESLTTKAPSSSSSHLSSTSSSLLPSSSSSLLSSSSSSLLPSSSSLLPSSSSLLPSSSSLLPSSSSSSSPSSSSSSSLLSSSIYSYITSSSISTSSFPTLSLTNSTSLQTQSSLPTAPSAIGPTSITNGTVPTSITNETVPTPVTPPPGYTITTISCDGSANISLCTGPGTTVATELTCTPLPPGKVYTSFSVVYTSTVTLAANETKAYRPKFSPLFTPDYCNPTVAPLVPSISAFSTLEGSIIVYSSAGGIYTTTTTQAENVFGLPTIMVGDVATKTLITTDKNPATVIQTPPGATPPPGRPTWPGGQIDHKPPAGEEPQAVHQGPFTITAGPDVVIINRHTYSNLGPGKTTIVTADNGGIFTIKPDSVVGEGATVNRPTPTGQPTPTHVGGLPVTVQPSNVIVGGGTFPIPTATMTVTVNGKSVVIGPDSISVDGETYSFSRPGQNNVVITGGELLTAIGASVVVLHSTTYTYGPGSSAFSKVVNGDTVVIGPTGVSVHGSLMGGPAADATDTEYEIVGGATIGKIPPSNFVINSKTYAVGPNAETRTVVIGDQTMTLGPLGLVMASTTMSYPFDADVVTTISPSGTSPHQPEETGKDEEDAAFSIRPDRRVGVVCLCIAMGAWILG